MLSCSLSSRQSARWPKFQRNNAICWKKTFISRWSTPDQHAVWFCGQRSKYTVRDIEIEFPITKNYIDAAALLRTNNQCLPVPVPAPGISSCIRVQAGRALLHTGHNTVDLPAQHLLWDYGFPPVGEIVLTK